MTDRLRRARARLLLAGLVRCAGWAAVAFAAAAAAVGAAVRWYPGVPTVPLLLAALGLAVVGAVVCGLRLTPDSVATARALERHFGLQERLSTSLEVAGRRGAMAEALREDAAAHARALDLAGFARPRLGRTQVAATACAAVLAGLAWLAPTGSGAGRLAQVAPDGPAAGATEAVAAPRELLTRLPAGAELTATAPAVDPDERTNARPSTPRDGAGSAAPTASRAAATRAAATPPTLDVSESPSNVERGQAEAGTTLAPPAGEGPPSAPRDAAELPTARNDGSTNPQPQQAGTRDQELREYARHREAAADAGGGGGEPVAMVDAAVAGDATAGAGEGAGQPLPQPAAGGEELSMPDVTDPSGRRVTVERLPDDVDPTGLDAAPAAVSFASGDEPTVSRALETPANLELLRRYFTAPEAPR